MLLMVLNETDLKFSRLLGKNIGHDFKFGLEVSL